jgi:hypothetical protein
VVREIAFGLTQNWDTSSDLEVHPQAELQEAIAAEEDAGYIRMKQDQVDMLAKKVQQEKRTLPGKMETLSPV